MMKILFIFLFVIFSVAVHAQAPFATPGGVAVPNSASPTIFLSPSGTVYGSKFNGANAAVAAAGTTQGTATLLTAPYSIVTSASASIGAGVILPSVAGFPAGAATVYTVFNYTGDAFYVYPASNNSIAPLPNNTPITAQPVLTHAFMYTGSGTAWMQIQ